MRNDSSNNNLMFIENSGKTDSECHTQCHDTFSVISLAEAVHTDPPNFDYFLHAEGHESRDNISSVNTNKSALQKFCDNTVIKQNTNVMHEVTTSKLNKQINNAE